MSRLAHSPIRSMIELARDVADTEDPVAIAALLADSASQDLGTAALAVYLTRPDGGMAVAQTRGGDPAAQSAPDPASPETWTNGLGDPSAFGMLRALPLASGGGLYGVLVLGWRTSPPDLTEVLALAEGLADTASIGIDRAYRTTELTRSLSQLAEQQAEIARTQGLRRMGQLAAVLAHEVRNPIAGIRGVLEVLRDRSAADAQERAVLAKALIRLSDLDRLVADVLQFARPQQAVRTRCPVLVLVRSATELIHLGSPDPDQAPQLNIDVQPHDLQWAVDAPKLTRLLMNLVQNAAQATGEAGRIDIVARQVADELVLQVIDSGPGVPDADLAQLFEPFVTTKSDGTGLGLAICRQIAESHGGSIAYGPSEGGGACFVVRLGP